MAASGPIYGVEIFQAGEARGETYDDAYILSLARNGLRFADTLTPTVVTGHEEGTDVPAVGVVQPKNMRVEYRNVKGVPRATLIGDFAEVPQFMADCIRSGNYRTVSAEIYPDYEGAGPTLRRVAVLGGEIPQIKSLATLREVMDRQPVTTFAERAIVGLTLTKTVKTDAGTVLCFSEVRTVTIPAWAKRFGTPFRRIVAKFADAPADMPPTFGREEMIAALGDAGVDVSTITDVIPDAFLAESLRVLQMQVEQTASEDAVEMSDEDKAKKEADDQAAAEAEAKRKEEEDKMNAEQTKKFSEQLASLQSVVDQAKADAAKAREEAASAVKFAEQQQAATRSNLIVSGVDAAIRQGRVTPAERDGLIAQLEASDAVTVRKFGEVEMTPLAHGLKLIAERPQVVKFGSRTKTAADPTEQDGEAYKVRKFAEENIDSIKKSGRTPDQYVETFKNQQKKNPSLTAAEFLGPVVA